MKLLFILLLCIFDNYSTIPKDPPEPEVGKRWILNRQYSDEFNGSVLDERKWRKKYVGWEGRTPGFFSPQSISVQEGTLQIKNGVLDPKVKVHTKEKYSIRGGAVQSKLKTAHFGYYECRFKASRINMSTTFWMSNGKVPVDFPTKISNGNCEKDQFSQELDIVESIGGVIDRHGDRFRKNMNFNTHYRYIDCEGGKEKFYSAGNNSVEGNGYKSNAALSSESWEDFHVYGAYWKNANEVSFYANNNYIGDVLVSTEVVDVPFPRPMGINMVTETYNWALPYPTNEELTNDAINTSYYDWVRSYQLVDVDAIRADDSFSNDSIPAIYTEEIRFFETPSIDGKIVKIPYVYKANADRVLTIKINDNQGKTAFETSFIVLAGYGKDIKTLNLPEQMDAANYTLSAELRTLDNSNTVIDIATP